MAKLVIELQKECVNQTLSYGTLFQKAYFVAQKLNQQSMMAFLKNEIDGYKKQSDVPQFRYVDVVYKAKNHMLGAWIPVSIPENNPLIRYLRYPVYQSVSEMESFLSSKGDTLVLSISAELQNLFVEMSVNKIPMEISAHFSKHQFKKILETEKRIICDWTIELEKQGVLGEEFEFSEEEKIRAQNMSITNITVNGSVSGSNIIGSVEKSSVVVNNDQFDFGAVEKFVDSISQMLQHSDVPKETQGALLLQVTDIKQKISEKDSIGVKKILGTMGDIVKNITGSVLASGIWNQIQSFLN